MKTYIHTYVFSCVCRKDVRFHLKSDLISDEIAHLIHIHIRFIEFHMETHIPQHTVSISFDFIWKHITEWVLFAKDNNTRTHQNTHTTIKYTYNNTCTHQNTHTTMYFTHTTIHVHTKTIVRYHHTDTYTPKDTYNNTPSCDVIF